MKANLNEADAAVSTIDAQRPKDPEAEEGVIEISSDAASSDYEFSGDEEGKEGDSSALKHKTAQDSHHQRSPEVEIDLLPEVL